jgi:hypothetical protein
VHLRYVRIIRLSHPDTRLFRQSREIVFRYVKIEAAWEKQISAAVRIGHNIFRHAKIPPRMASASAWDQNSSYPSPTENVLLFFVKQS